LKTDLRQTASFKAQWASQRTEEQSPTLNNAYGKLHIDNSELQMQKAMMIKAHMPIPISIALRRCLFISVVNSAEEVTRSFALSVCLRDYMQDSLERCE